jgi:hypothetical protein
MATFLFTYRGGGTSETDKDRARETAAWSTWYDDLGPALIDRGNAVSQGWVIHSDGEIDADASEDPVTGYSVIEAASMDDALGIALGCPIRNGGGRIEVLETLEAMEP